MALAVLLYYLLGLLQLAIVVRAVLSWVQLAPDNPIVHALDVVCEPLLAPLRQVLPAMGGLDFSPLAAIFALGILQRFVAGVIVG